MIQPTAKSGDRKRFALLAEDNQPQLMTMTLLLKVAGWEVKCCQNGLEALRAAELSHFDVAILDQRMPGAEGLAVVARLRDQGVLDMPVIIVTNDPSKALYDQAALLGVKKVIPKPIHSGLFAMLVDQAVREAAQTSAAVPGK